MQYRGYKVKPLTLKDYQAEVADYQGTVILFFTATWDTAGIDSKNYLESQIESNPDIKFFSVDYDVERELVNKFSVRFMPLIIVLKNGRTISMRYSCTFIDQWNILIGNK